MGGHWFSRTSQEVIPGLYIGHVWNATDPAELRRAQITHIVDVSARKYPAPPNVEMLRLPVPDVPEFDIRTIFGQTNTFIQKARQKGGNVLVHCAWGVSRSASVVLAYLMSFGQQSLDNSFRLLRSKRYVVNPNRGFWAKLQLYEKELDDYRRPNQHD